MKVRYFLSFLVVIAFFLFTCMSLTGEGFGTNFLLLLNLPTAFIVIIFPLILMGILSGWKNIGSAFSVLSNKEADKNVLLNAETFFENYGKTIFLTAFTAFIISFIYLLAIEDNEPLKINLAMASILLFYAGITNMVIILPYKILLKRKLIEMENS